MKKQCPLVVWLSEDSTKITPRIEYENATNQLVGFVLPFNENGMPKSASFVGRTAKEFEYHFQNQSEAGTIHVVMAQPVMQGMPPFCLKLFGSDNKFTAKDVLKRWKYTKIELKKGNKIISIGHLKDRQILNSAEKMSNHKIIDLLSRYVPDNSGTILYLTSLRV